MSTASFNPDEDDVVRVCMKVSEIDNPVAGSVIRQCRDCGEDVWFAENQQFAPGQEYGETPDVILCGPCAIVFIAVEGALLMNLSEEPIHVKPMTEEMTEYLNEQ